MLMILFFRRQPQVAPYKLKCDKEPLNARHVLLNNRFVPIVLLTMYINVFHFLISSFSILQYSYFFFHLHGEVAYLYSKTTKS